MAENQDPISHIRAITISREYGSGGGEIAAHLARKLGWQLIDHEVVVRAAQELGVSEAEVEAHDEQTETVISRILTNIRMIEPAVLGAAPLPEITEPQTYHEALRRVVLAAAQTGQVVIVGRGAQILLAELRDVLHVRIVAPLEMRVAYVMRREGLDQAAASSRVRLKDRDRTRYLQAQYRQDPADAHLYDLVVNTAILDLDSVVDMICLALERKARRLSVPLEEVGPATGLPRYPTRPSDFRPPESMTGSSQS
jgi:cytidylate kinase